MSKVYLGDSVYARWDGWNITLTTDNGDGPSNTIIMEPRVVHNLAEFANAHLKGLLATLDEEVATK